MMHILRGRRALTALGATTLLLASAAPASASVDLADAPLFSTVSVPGNLLLALSVEFPTASTAAYANTIAYATGTEFVGYFDPNKCYTYHVVDVATTSGSTTTHTYDTSYFVPYGAASGHACASTASTLLWSGNWLNYAGMQSLDEFRWVLTGGNRTVDTSSLTILQKTYHSGQASSGNTAQNKAITGTTLIGGATPLPTSGSGSWSTVNSRTAGTGVMMLVSSSSSSNALNLSTLIPSTSDYTIYSGQSPIPSGTVYAFYMNVQVCASAALKESNCVQYGSSYKPEGLMQAYSDKLRFAAMGYLSDPGSDTTNLQRNGGVLRAAMTFVGPNQPVPGSAAIPNTAAEWSSSTGIMGANPDPTDASNTTGATISQSGVMNYLNKFGYAGKKYKYYDPVGELYYAGIRYFRGLAPVAAYDSLTTNSTAAILLDGFPMITTQVDPILYSCQKNFILGLGDTNTNYDAGLPGNMSNQAGLSTFNEPASTTEPEVTGDPANVITYTNMIGKIENNSTNLASTNVSNGTYFIAGLAYDAHTNGVRTYTDTAGNVTKATVNTYWLDVLEGQTYKGTNQYYYATKYGGFTLPDGVYPFGTVSATGSITTIQPYSLSNTTNTIATINTASAVNTPGTPISLALNTGNSNALWHTNSDRCSGSLLCGSTVTTGDYRPDNYFTANNAANMKASLTTAFQKIASEAGAANGTTLSTPSVNTTQNGSVTYGASYDANSWTGIVTASSISFALDGTPSTTFKWDARVLLSASSVTKDTRKIITCCTSSTTAPGLEFTAAGLGGSTVVAPASNAYASSGAQYFAQVPGVSSTNQSVANYLAYLRGDTSQELSASAGHYRTRSFRLGDIVNSKPTTVRAPNQGYLESSNPGYATFKSTYASRATVVYVGANDGMLHAFDGSIDLANSGQELFAYIPSFVYGDSTTALTSGIATLGDPSFTHHYFVDATPGQFDVDLVNTYASSTVKATSTTRSMCTATQTSTATNWCTLLVGGLGKGGKGYYALDVTAPAVWSNNSNTAAANQTALASKVMWEFTDTHMGYTYGTPTVVKTKKWGWVVVLTSGYNNDDGIGYFYFVSPSTGALLERVATTSGSTTSPINMGQNTAFEPDYTDGTADAIYGVDLQGDVWRLDVTATTGAYAAPTLIATLTDGSGNAQPITTRPLVEPDSSSAARYLLLGTGRLLGDSDILSARVQSFYAIIDGTANFGGFYTSGGTAPTLPSTLTFPIGRSELNANTNLLLGITAAAGADGWYYDLPVNAGIAERVNIDPAATSGIIAWAGNLPNGSACSPAGTGEKYATSFSTGKTVLWDGTTYQRSFSDLLGVISDVSFLNVSGTTYLYSGDSKGNITKDSTKVGSTSGVKQMNWRDVPIAN